MAKHSPRRAHRAPAVTWTCDECGKIIARNTGYLCVDDRAAYSLDRERTKRRIEVESREQKFDGFVLWTGEDLEYAHVDDDVRWHAFHRACDPEPDRGDYWIDIERVETFGDLLEWNAHLHEKNWVGVTDWPEFIIRAAPRNSPPATSQTKTHRPTISPRRRFNILQRDGFRCQLCGRTAEQHGVTLEIDHQQPISRGGTDDDANLWTLCRDCNAGKSDKC